MVEQSVVPLLVLESLIPLSTMFLEVRRFGILYCGRSEILNDLSFSMEKLLETRKSENHLDSYVWLKY